MNDSPPRILLVEDDLELAALIAERLDREGYETTRAADGPSGRDAALAERFDLVILDVMLPGIDGFEVCRAIRPRFAGPILMMTARDDDVDQILGLELGADDYVLKPVRPRVLLARVRALLRRASAARGHGDEGRVVVGELVVDAACREVRLGARTLELTTTEFDLLHFLAQRAGHVVARDTVYRELRGTEYDGLDRSIDVYVSRLRAKLGDDPKRPRILKTVRGVGYLVAASDGPARRP